ncbi:MAG: hypothetical protein AAF394_01415 [Planctomycetota bacterium]
MQTESLAPCPHRSGSCCQVVALLAEVDVSEAKVDGNICERCSLQQIPQQNNAITCVEAIGVRHRLELPVGSELRQCVRAASECGVGTEFERLLNRIRHWLGWIGLAWLVLKQPGCGCNDLRNAMNATGIEGCSKNAWKYATRISARFSERNQWLFWFSPVVQLLGYHCILHSISVALKQQSSK